MINSFGEDKKKIKIPVHNKKVHSYTYDITVKKGNHHEMFIL